MCEYGGKGTEKYGTNKADIEELVTTKPLVALNRYDPVDIRFRNRYKKLRRICDFYLITFISTVSLALIAMFLGATHEPFRQVVFGSAWSLILYSMISISIPFVMHLAFPPPFTRKLLNEMTALRLKRERIKLTVLFVMSGSLFTKIFYFTDIFLANSRHEVGWILVACVITISTWILWPYQVEGWRAMKSKFSLRKKQVVPEKKNV